MANKEKSIFVVIAYRWGKRENHSYTVGAFNNEKKAKACAESHTTYRGGKYACVVEKCLADHFNNDDDDYTEEIYRTKSAMEL
ncbi:MAG: hypothetical protein ACK5OS_02005 [Chryseotalea sp.]